MQKQFDVLIIGAGPAGLAAAIQSALAGMDTCIVERRSFPKDRPGETLHPGVEPLLKQLGVYQAFKPLSSIRPKGIWSRWNGTWEFNPYQKIVENNVENSALWRGYQVLGRDFDQLLLNRAKKLGVVVKLKEAVRHLVVSNKRVAGVTTDYSDLKAKYIFDATGSWRWLSRQLGYVDKYYSPKLLTRYGFVSGNHPDVDDDPRLKADATGWTWIAHIKRDLYQWTRLELCAKQTAKNYLPPELKNLKPLTPSKGAYLTWSKVGCTSGSGFFILGDAACILDPASSHGVLKALMTGIHAAYLTHHILQKHIEEQDVIRIYQTWVNNWFCYDIKKLNNLYALAFAKIYQTHPNLDSATDLLHHP